MMTRMPAGPGRAAAPAAAAAGAGVALAGPDESENLTQWLPVCSSSVTSMTLPLITGFRPLSPGPAFRAWSRLEIFIPAGPGAVSELVQLFKFFN